MQQLFWKSVGGSVKVLKCSFEGLPWESQIWRVWPWFSWIQICLAGCLRFFTLFLCKIVSTIWQWCLSEAQRWYDLFCGRTRANSEWLCFHKERQEGYSWQGCHSCQWNYTLSAFTSYESFQGLSQWIRKTVYWHLGNRHASLSNAFFGDVSKPPFFLCLLLDEEVRGRTLTEGNSKSFCICCKKKGVFLLAWQQRHL